MLKILSAFFCLLPLTPAYYSDQSLCDPILSNKAICEIQFKDFHQFTTAATVPGVRKYASYTFVTITASDVGKQLNRFFYDFPAIQTLEIHRTRISNPTAIDFLFAYRLEVLIICDTPISILSEYAFAAARYLRTLDLSRNRIHTIAKEAFAGLESLRSLSLRENAITRFDADDYLRLHVTSLVTLDLSKNPLSEGHAEEFGIVWPNGYSGSLNLAWTNLSRVEFDVADGSWPKEMTFHLNLKGNAIGKVEVGEKAMGNEMYFGLDLSNNGMSELPEFNALSRVRNLNLGFNPMDWEKFKAVVEEATLLEDLRLTNTEFSLEHWDLLDPLKELKVLDLTLNGISEFDLNKINNFEKLTMLILDHNDIRDLNIEALERPEAEEPKTSGLKSLSISMDGNNNLICNHLEKLIQQAEDLGIRIYGNLDGSLGGFYVFNGIKCLDKKKIKCSPLPEAWASSLEDSQKNEYCYLPEIKVFMDSEYILESHSGDPIRSMYIDKSKIEKLPVFNYEELKTLRISRGLRVMIDFQELKSLEKLDLTNNELTRIHDNDLKGLGEVQELDLSFNKIRIVEEKAFADLVKVRRINLRGNLLPALFRELFQDLTALEEIDLRDNSIRGTLYVTWNGNKALNLRLSYNPIKTITIKRDETKEPESVYISAEKCRVDRIQITPELPETTNLRLLLKENAITHLSNITSISNVIYLDVSNNPLEIDEENPLKLSLPKVEFLHLDKTGILDEDLKNLKNFPTLKELSLATNQLDEFDLPLINELPELTKLVLQENMIATLDTASVKERKKTLQLAIDYNEFHCNGLRKLLKDLEAKNIVTIEGGPQFGMVGYQEDAIQGIKCRKYHETADIMNGLRYITKLLKKLSKDSGAKRRSSKTKRRSGEKS